MFFRKPDLDDILKTFTDTINKLDDYASEQGKAAETAMKISFDAEAQAAVAEELRKRAVTIRNKVSELVNGS